MRSQQPSIGGRKLSNKRAFFAIVALSLAALAFAPAIGAYNNGVLSSNQEYGCGGSCHDNDSTCVITMSASNMTPAPGATVTVWVNVTGGQAYNSPLGVMVVSATTTTNSQPSADGWTILADPSGTTTTYNYHQVSSYTGSAKLSWSLSAPSTLGIHTLFARVLHGNGGAAVGDYPSGLVFTVTDYSGGGDDGGDDGGTTPGSVPTLVITSPSNSATVRGNMTINANVVSVDAIVSATLKIDGAVVGQLTSAPFTWVVDTTNLTEGGHLIVVTVVDVTGDTVSKEIAVFVDNESELVSMLEWIVTLGAGTVIIVCLTGMAVIFALYIRKKVVDRRSR